MRHERNHYRDLRYSLWHRAASMERYLQGWQAASLTYLDIDGIEHCAKCNDPLALVETAHWTGIGDAPVKNTIPMERLAAKYEVPAYLVFYECKYGTEPTHFRVRRLPDGTMWDYAPGEWADVLWELRENHRCKPEHLPVGRTLELALDH